MATDNKMPARPDQSISLEVLAMDTCLSDKKITELALMADQVLRKELLLEELISGDHHKAREDVFGALSKDIETFDTQDKLIDFFGQIDDEEALAAAIQEHAPSVTQIVESGIENDNVGELLGEFGINAKSLNKETMTRMKLQSYYAKKIGGDEGVSRFTQLVSKAKNTMAKKTSKRRLGLSISAGLLGASVAIGASPAGMVVGALSFSNKLINNTEKGRELKENFVKASREFLTKMGVSMEAVDKSFRRAERLRNKAMAGRMGVVVSAVVVGAVALSAAAITMDPETLSSGVSSILESLSPPELPVEPGTLPDVDIEVSDSPTIDEGATSIEVNDQSNGEPSYEEPGVLTEPIEPKMVTVEPNDTLWGIAEKDLLESTGSIPTELEILERVNDIAVTNNIANPDVIYPGQVFDLSQTELTNALNVEPPGDTLTTAVADVAAPAYNTIEEYLTENEVQGPINDSTSPTMAP